MTIQLQTQHPIGLHERDDFRVFEEVFEALPAVEVIEEILDGDARAIEAWDSAHPLGVSPDELFEFYFFLWCNSRHDSSYLVADIRALYHSDKSSHAV